MISLIPNQPIRFRTQAEIDAEDTCGGQPFAQKIEIGDPTQFQITFDPNVDIEPGLDLFSSTGEFIGTIGTSAQNDNSVDYFAEWQSEGITEGCYKLRLIIEGTSYYSDLIDLREEHSGTILLSWANDENAFGIEYNSITHYMRVDAKLRNPVYEKEEKEVFVDSAGNRTILRSMTVKTQLLIVADMPEYMHDALAVALEHDTFEIDGVEYINEETEYSPSWRKSSLLAPVQVEVMKKSQNLINGAC